jgi:hypothetical protein
MIRRGLFVAVVFAVLAVSAQPVAAADAGLEVASENTTASDLNDATISGGSVSGSGSSAYVETLSISSTTTLPDDDDSSSTNSARGLVINPNVDLSTITIEIYDSLSGVTDAYIRQSDGTLVTSSNINGDTATLDASSLTPGTDYYLTVDAGGSSYTSRYDSDPSFPYTSSAVDVVDGANGPSLSFGDAYNIKTIDASETTEQATYIGDAHNADHVEDGWANLSLSNAKATITWQASQDGGSTWSNVSQTTVSSTQNLTQDLSGTDASDWRVRIDFEKTGSSPTAELHDEGVLFQAQSPSGANPYPPDGSNVDSYDGDISIDVTDSDFGTEQGDSVTVTASDTGGGQIGQETLTSNGTATISYSADAGENNITWTLSDSYGESATVEQNFATPSTLTIYNVSSPDSVITESKIEVQFLEDGEKRVVVRNTSNGKVDMSGVPADASLIVRAEAKGYYIRTTLLESIYEQQEVYLLPKNQTNTSTVEFSITDRTRVFGADSELQVSRALNTSDSNDGELIYKAVAGDRIGSQQTVVTTLERNVRYRIQVSNDQQTRTLGSFTPVTSGRVVELTIGRVEFRAAGGDGYTFNPSFKTGPDKNNTDDNDPSDGPRIVVKYFDSTNSTEDVTIEIYERGNSSNVLISQTTQGSVAQLENVYALDENESQKQWMVRLSATRNGESFEFVRPVGGTNVPLPMDSKWLGSMALVAITFVQLLFGGRLAAWGSVVTCVLAGVLMMFQWVPINPVFYSLAFLIAVGGHVRANGGIGP